MRIVGGADRGRRLRAPRGQGTRPTAERVREALFDILGPAVAGTRVLDLYAGTGAVGLEALSRGATRAVFVEKDPEALRALRQNLATLAASRAAARVVAGDAVSALATLGREEAPFDLAFLDPPYAASVIPRVLGALVLAGLLAPRARVIVQHFAKVEVAAPAGLVVDGAPRRFGETALTFLAADGYTPPGPRSRVRPARPVRPVRNVSAPAGRSSSVDILIDGLPVSEEG
jgi:16S rRNA (guanine966-N2)-methyltransferase